MHSSLVSTIEKAQRYAQEPDRIELSALNATFHGGHDDHVVSLKDGQWTCNCHVARSGSVGGVCSHIIALQKMLDPMLSQQARQWQGVSS